MSLRNALLFASCALATTGACTIAFGEHNDTPSTASSAGGGGGAGGASSSSSSASSSSSGGGPEVDAGACGHPTERVEITAMGALGAIDCELGVAGGGYIDAMGVLTRDGPGQDYVLDTCIVPGCKHTTERIHVAADGFEPNIPSGALVHLRALAIIDSGGQNQIFCRTAIDITNVPAYQTATNPVASDFRIWMAAGEATMITIGDGLFSLSLGASSCPPAIDPSQGVFDMVVYAWAGKDEGTYNVPQGGTLDFDVAYDPPYDQKLEIHNIRSCSLGPNAWQQLDSYWVVSKKPLTH